ncbi:hypothetical protein GGX14DRAFT_655038 [Mycena pura]|uniref:Uncharacterized protein n=1 Tax=Mycena pura TaxID=153505 RepID=A0AAD6VAT9_9AGAR|nr:hypothetical protein GGX14DRAFT_655038 [Mycena pura]
MQSTNSTSSHYRENTREQNGWTVLAPPLAAAELPPPYAAEDNLTPAAAPAATLLFQIPTNSNIIGAVPVTQTKKYAHDIPFGIAFPEICNTMGLASPCACIGYKWENERVSAPVHQLRNAADWTHCLESGIGMQSRARTRTVICVIRNLNLPEETAPATSSAFSTSIAASVKKRKSCANPSSPDGKKTFDFTQEYRQLKKHLECAMHKGQMCFVSNVDGHHKEVDREHVSLWAKEITIGNASLSKPPANIMFQDYFLPAPKRVRDARDTRISSTNPCAPTIHVTVNTGTSTGSSRVSPSPPRPSRRSPLSTITAATANADNIDIPSSLYRAQPDTDVHGSSSFHDVRYPTVIEVLQMIDDSGLFADSGVLAFPVVVFADDLAQSQITHVDHVPLLDTAFYVQVVNMPAVVAELFVEESIAAMGRAQKGKGRM